MSTVLNIIRRSEIMEATLGAKSDIAFLGVL